MLTSDLSFIVSMLSFAAHLPRAPAAIAYLIVLQ